MTARDSIGKIMVEGEESWGTAWIVAPGYVATAAHCVAECIGEGESPDRRVTVVFPTGIACGEMIWASRVLDVALVRLVRRPACGGNTLDLPNLSPLPLGELAIGEEWQPPAWEGFGFSSAHAEGLALTGTVDSPSAEDRRHAGASPEPAIQLFCQQGGSGDSALAGVSGSAVLVGGRVCGIIYWAPVPLAERVIFATPLTAVAKEFSLSQVATEHPALERSLRDTPTIHLDRFDASLGAYLAKFQTLRLRTGTRGSEPILGGRATESFAWPSIRPLQLSSTACFDPTVQSNPDQALPSKVTSAFSLAAANNKKHVFLFGQAGVGKSTLLRQYARSAWHDPSSLGLETRHLPLLVRLQSLSNCTECHLEPLLDQSSEVRLPVAPPEGFLEQWHLRTGAPWLLLFDGLDEVPEPLLPRTIDRLFGFVEEEGPWKCVFTSRFFPASRLTDELHVLFGSCGVFELLSLSAQVAKEYSEAVLGSAGKRFFDQLNRLKLGDNGFTPLMLSISLKLFTELHSIPRRRSDLYALFVQQAFLNSAQSQALAVEVDPRLVKYNLSISLLEDLAAKDTQERSPMQTADCSKFFGKVLRQSLSVPSAEAPLMGERFLMIVCQRSGILYTLDGEVRWAHQTFREYLTACALVSSKDDERQMHCVGQWGEAHWKQIVLFVLAILSRKESEKVGRMVEKVLDQERNSVYAELFFGLAIAEGATFPDSLVQRIAEQIGGVALRGGTNDYCRSVYEDMSESGGSPTDLLGWMLPSVHAENELRAVIRDKDVKPWQKVNAIKALCGGGRYSAAIEECKCLPKSKDKRVVMNSVRGLLPAPNESRKVNTLG